MSVSAITADSLQASNITDITGLNGSVPGLVVARSGGGERVLSIRGIGSETPENTNTQPGVSYHIDGVYIFNSIAASAAFVDVGHGRGVARSARHFVRAGLDRRHASTSCPLIPPPTSCLGYGQHRRQQLQRPRRQRRTERAVG